VTVYVDQLFKWGTAGKYPNEQAERVGARNNHEWCHMWSPDVNELKELAKKIGLQPGWIQNSRGFVHFDLVASKRTIAVKYGAVEVDMREMHKLYKSHLENKSNEKESSKDVEEAKGEATKIS
jgi:hypothetical protein